MSQKKNPETNADADALLELVVQAAPTGIVMADAEGRIMLANQRAEELFGYQGKEWDSLTVEDLIPQSARQAHQHYRSAYAEDRTPRSMGVGRDLFALRKDGTEFAVEVGLSPITSPRGQMVVASIIDITERKEAERERARLSRETELNAEVLRNVHDGVFLTTMEGKIRTWNEGAEAVYGHTSSEAIGKHVRILLPDEDLARFENKVLPKVLSGQKLKMIVWSKHKSGRRIAVSLHATLMKNDTGEPEGVIICANDITEQKKLEDLLVEASESEQRRIGRDIHDDLCQQLAGIGCLTKVLEQRLEAVYDEAANSLRQIGDMVSQANVRARDIARGLVPAVLESDGLCGALKDLCFRTEEVFGVKCELWCPDPVEMPDSKVSVQLYRIAQEAVSNAVKHGNPTSIIITLDRREDLLKLDVRDDGHGMAEKADDDGMGLMTMAHRAQVLGGDLEIHSNNEEGTHVACSVNLANQPT